MAYHNIDLWGDSLLNGPAHAAGSWQASHNRVAQELARIASTGGISTTAAEVEIPTVSSSSRKRGDLMTRRGGRIPLCPSPPFDRFTRLVMDVKLGHVFDTVSHTPKPRSIRDMERAVRGPLAQGRASGHVGRRAVTKSRDEVTRAKETMMNWNDDRTLDEVEAGIVSPERFGGIMPEGERTFRDDGSPPLFTG